jgi:hypothetical protein
VNASFGATSPENSRPAERFVIPPNFAPTCLLPAGPYPFPVHGCVCFGAFPRPIRSRSKPPGFILPCRPALADRPPSGPGWLHEIKFDGYRVIARKDGEQVRLWARTTSDYSKTFKEALVGDQVTPEALCVVTDREIAAGGMLPDAGYGRSRLAAAKSSSQAMASVSTWLARLPGQSLFFRRSSVLPWVSRRAVVCQGRRGGRRRQVQQYRRGLGTT